MKAFSESRFLRIALATAAGAGIGRLVGQDTAWTIVGAVIGLGTVTMIVIVGVRPIVAIPVAVGAGIGAYVGGTIVGVLCQPTGCAAFEAGAATVTGVGALVGIGLVVALATRSFDEYNEAIDRGQPPPTTGCNTDDRID
jgi:hypothetical protein